MYRRLILVLAVVVAAVVAAFSASPTSVVVAHKCKGEDCATATPKPTKTPTPKPSATNTPLPTSTATPTITPTPANTAPPTATATPANAATPTAKATQTSAVTTTGTATATNIPTPTAAATPTPGASDPVIAAAGDIACIPGAPVLPTSCQQQAIANLPAAGASAGILSLGDSQYESGALAEFQSSYDPAWGRFRGFIHPVPGNHEYGTSGAAGYFSYYGSAAGDPSKGYYSYDIGSWHLIVLNSNCTAIGGCNAGSPEEQWLRGDLAAHHNVCTLA